MSNEKEQAIKSEICSVLGERSLEFRRIGTGLAGPQYVVRGRKSYFLKLSDSSTTDVFVAEVAGLAALAVAGPEFVPQVYGYGTGSSGCPPYLVMELLDIQPQTSDAERRLGEILARVHSISSEGFGFDRDNYIGRNVQRNAWSQSWGEFFVDRRLRVQLELAYQQGWVTAQQLEAFDSRRSLCAGFFENGGPPALVHGDLWSGNAIYASRGPVLIDPAVSFSSADADIAFTEMFGGFGKAFYEGYRDKHPQSRAYSRTKNFLNLYHWLNHGNLFGGHYRQQSLELLYELLKKLGVQRT